MRRAATIALTTGAAVTILGGGIAMAYDGGGRPAADHRAERAATSVTSSPTAAPTAGTSTSRATAERIALGAVPGGRIRSAELEVEHGRQVWKVDVIAGGVVHEVYVDLGTGKVIRDRAARDDARDDNRHDALDDRRGGRHDDAVEDGPHHGGGDDSGHRGGDDRGHHGGRD